jgi:hypothetical protein
MDEFVYGITNTMQTDSIEQATPISPVLNTPAEVSGAGGYATYGKVI